MSFKTVVSLLISFLNDLSIGVSGILKSTTTNVLSISSFIPVKIYFIHIGASVLGACILTSIISLLALIFLSLYNALSFGIDFVLKSVLSDMSNAAFAFLLFPFPPLHFQCVCLCL